MSLPSGEAGRPVPARSRPIRSRLDASLPTTLRVVALASLLANIIIVITGGAVRLTGSGLGCPTWPRCVASSYVPTGARGYHGLIEFGNRTLFFVVGLFAVAALLAVLLERPRRRRRVVLAALVLAGIPAQAVLGGLTVLTKLNPWLVASHFLLSIAVITPAFLLWADVRDPGSATRAAGPGVEPVGPGAGPSPLGRPLRALVVLVTVVCALVLAIGTVVTGSGPHAGDAHARRTGLDPGMVAQLHADAVMLLIGLSVAFWLALAASRTPRETVRSAAVLVAVELSQGVIGFVQYFTHLPVLLVGLHMAGACAVWVATLALLLRATSGRPAPHVPAPAPRDSLASVGGR